MLSQKMPLWGVLLLVVAVALLATGLDLRMSGHAPSELLTPRSVAAQEGGTTVQLKKSSCSPSSSTTGVYSYFVCVADLDGTGTQQIVIGRVYAVSDWHVKIINNDGSVRASLSF
jgi:hypothetical protein